MRRKHIPMRMCVGCRSSFPKKELIRVVRNPEGNVELDLTGKSPGRGVYLCPKEKCLENAVKQKQLERALATKISPQVLDNLKRVLHEQNI